MTNNRWSLWRGRGLWKGWGWWKGWGLNKLADMWTVISGGVLSTWKFLNPGKCRIGGVCGLIPRMLLESTQCRFLFLEGNTWTRSITLQLRRCFVRFFFPPYELFLISAPQRYHEIHFQMLSVPEAAAGQPHLHFCRLARRPCIQGHWYFISFFNTMSSLLWLDIDTAQWTVKKWFWSQLEQWWSDHRARSVSCYAAQAGCGSASRVSLQNESWMSS